MWWEIIPSAGIVIGALMVPHGAFFIFNKIFNNGKSVSRNWYAGHTSLPDYNVYLRDHRITGSEYIPQGLEAITDEECK